MWLLAIWFVLAGIGIGCIETAEHSAVATHAPEDIRGSAFGLLAAAQSFGNLAASGIAGILWAAVSPTAAFGYIAAWMFVALIALALRSSHDQIGLDRACVWLSGVSRSATQRRYDRNIEPSLP